MGHAMTDMMDKKAYASSGMVWGLLIGLAAGMLLAPGSGRENRAKLQQKVGELKDKAKHQRDNAADKLGDAADKLQNITDKTEEMAARGRNRNPPAAM